MENDPNPANTPMDKHLHLVFDILLLVVGLGLILASQYLEMNQTLELVVFKALLISAAILHAHVTCRVILRQLLYSSGSEPVRVVCSCATYWVIIWAYARGG